MTLSENFYKAFLFLVSADSELYNIIFLSLFISGLATFFATTIALPFGVWLAITKFPMRGVLVSLLNSLTGLPPVVLGLSVYLLLSRAGPLGSFGILYTPTAMILTQIILVFPIIAATIRIVAEERYTHVSPYYSMLNIPKYKVVISMLYDLRFMIFSSIMVGLGRALSEVGAMLIVGGNIDGHTRIMTTAISLETGRGNLSFALAIGAVLLSIIIIINSLSAYTNTLARKYYGL